MALGDVSCLLLEDFSGPAASITSPLCHVNPLARGAVCVSLKTKQARNPFAGFEGYTSPHYTQVPDQFFDEHLRHLSGAEAKIMLVLFRQTLGWKKRSEKMSVPQIALRAGSGESTVRRVMKDLDDKGLVQVTRHTTQAGDPDANTYTIRWSQNERTIGNRSSQNERTVLSEEEDPPLVSGAPEHKHTLDTHRSSHTGLAQLAQSFLQSIGYRKPSRTKRERTLRILTALLKDDGYTLDEIETACRISAELGAHGPELIPHVIGQKPSAPETRREVGERLREEQAEEHQRWQSLAARFDALPPATQRKLMKQARTANRIIADRPDEHPLVRAAAIALLDEEP
jgi:predicted ArsR family transcriptional regulator